MNTFFSTPFTMLFFSALVFLSCSSDESVINDETAQTTFGAKATFESERINNELLISTFLVNVEDFELEFDDDDFGDDDGGPGGNFYGDLELEGPFELDLSQPDVVFPFANIEIPLGQYEELEFDITRSSNSESILFQRSILIEGTIQGMPFVFWHNFEEDVEVDFEDTNIDIVVESNGESVVINFDLSFLFNTNIIDLSNATDNNGDGVIEISPNDQDGNNALANLIKETIKEAIELLDD
ncbi:hypothetical protein [uncultured Planktosalinus sp.]|uniref:hypothetical protein n=1 Tax=uncultured Planktosalinus sp. TaxID=1810935 RepID=UPI0030DA857F